MIRIAIIVASFAATQSHAEIVSTSASVRSDNALIVDIQVTTGGSAGQIGVTYQTAGVDPLVSRWTPVSTNGPTTITIGRLRASKAYTYSVRAIDDHGAPAGTARGSFTTGPLPAPLAMSTFKLTGRMSVPLVILPIAPTGFSGYVAMDLHSADAPQIVWYYSNPPSNASGKTNVDAVAAFVRESGGNFLFADAGTGPPPLSADSFYREIATDGTLLSASPAACGVTPPSTSPTPKGWIWGQGNDVHEVLAPGADGTILHLAKIVKDPFFDAGLAPQKARLQSGVSIRRWDPVAETDEIVWDPFQFLNPLTERTSAANSDPAINSDESSAFPCAGATMQIEEWMHSNSLQAAPTGVLLMSVRHLDTVIAISPQFDRIAWRLGRFGSDFTFPNPGDRFYHEHYVRMLDNGNILLFDNGNGRPAAEGGQYSRALELALDWNAMRATKVWEYRHQLGDGSYKYADKVGVAQRLENGNTLVWYGADIDPMTLATKNPQTLTLVEADANPEASAVATLDVQTPGNGPAYRVLPVETLFGEVAGTSIQ